MTHHHRQDTSIATLASVRGAPKIDVDGTWVETATVSYDAAHVVAHGLSTSQTKYPMQFLHVLSGPADARTTALYDGPDHHRIREMRADPGTDSRLPLTAVSGRVAR